MTEMRRILLLSLLFLIGMTLWNTWIAEHAPKPTPTQVSESVAQTTQQAATDQAVAITPTTATTVIPPNNKRYIQVKTNVIEATIDSVGGTLVNVKLLKYPVARDEPNTPFVLFNQQPNSYYVATSGITGSNLPATNQMVFTVSQQSYVLSPGAENITVNLTWQNQQGLKIIKTYIFPADDYLIQMKQQIDNQTASPWQGHFFAELQREPVAAGGMGPFHMNTYLGAVISSPDKRYEKISFKQMDENDLDQTIQNGWLAMVEHYFLSAWVPDPAQNFHYYTHTSPMDDTLLYTIGLQSPTMQVAAKQSVATNAQLYVGPELGDRLAKIAPGLNLTVDYGILWFIAILIFGLMKKIYLLTGNWGWSIVLVTMIIKLLFYKLNSMSFRSMAAMRDLQPKIQQLRERCGDDKQKLAQGTMELYRKEKVNPLGGCLPLLIQIPVFLSLYWVLAESVELRQAPFILWIHDLSTKDPYYILPLIMGLTIFIQQRFAPKAPDPMQQKVMMMLPIIFTVFFLSFPAGLVLYWVVNNSLSILQQWYVMNHVVPKAAAKKAQK